MSIQDRGGVVGCAILPLVVIALNTLMPRRRTATVTTTMSVTTTTTTSVPAARA